MPNRENHARIAAGAEHACGVAAMQRERLFTEYLLASSGSDDHLVHMQGMRRYQQNGIDRAIIKDLLKISGQVEMMFGAKASRVVDIGLDGTDDL
jgi:hypothetical protein